MASKPAKSKSAWQEGKTPASVEEYCQCLDASRVMSAEDCRAFMASLPEEKRPQTAKALALELLKTGKLTRYQAQGVLQGKIRFLTFGEYFILEKLGEGGMGQVFKAEHRRMQRTVALKVLSGAAMKDADARKRFEREVHAAARLIHPNIVTAFDANEHEGVHFLVMEFVDGHDLSVILGKQGPLPPATAIDYVLQAARALSFAHSKGVVHRDIKPGNLLLDREGTVKILDMGLARIDLGGGGQELTNTGQVMGTVDYMAPEQAEDTHSADARADIYSLGCTLYRLLSGDVLYGGDSVVKKILAHRGAEIPPLRAVCPAAPAALEVTYRKMVAKKAADRQQTMADVVAELEGVVRDFSRIPAATISSGAAVHDKLSEFLTGLNTKTSKSATTTALKSSTRVSAATEVTQDFRAENTTTGLSDFRSIGSSEPTVAVESPLKKRLVSWGWFRGTGALIAGGLGLVALAVAGIVMFLPTGNGTIRVEINDPSIEVTVHESGYKIKGKAEEIHIKPGEHALHVKQGELEFDTNKFVIGKGENPAVKVELLPWGVQVVRPDGTSLGSQRRSRAASGAVPPTASYTGANHALKFGGEDKVVVPTLVNKFSRSGPLTMEAFVTPEWPAGSITNRPNLVNFDNQAVLRVSSGNEYYTFSIYRNKQKQTVDAAVKAQAGKRAHVASVFEAAEMRIYVDGKLAGKAALVPGLMDTIADPLELGDRLVGQLDEIRISSVARYAADFTPATRFAPDKDTLALYHCDEGTGEVLNDSSGNNHHGQLIGSKWAGPAAGSSSGGAAAAGSSNWTELFNGRDLAGWLQKGHSGWSVKDGVLTGTTSGPVGWLMAAREYGDFELELEYQLPPGGNSGVFVRAPEEGNVTGGQFNEIQLLDDPSPKFKSVDPKGRNGALFSQVAPTKAPIKAANTWRKMIIGVTGNKVQITLDGEKILDAPLCAGTASRGHIGLQLYDPGASFRNIRVRELSADGSGANGTASATSSNGAAAASSLPTSPAVVSNTPRWPFDPADGKEHVWSEPENLGTGINSERSEGLFGVSSDGKTIYYGILNGGRVLASTRTSDSGVFPAGKQLKTPYSAQAVDTISADGLVLVGSVKEEGKLDALWMATRKSTSEGFGPAAILPEPVNPAGRMTRHGVLSPDGLTLLATLTRPGGGHGDIWMFTRASRDESFANAQRIPDPISGPNWEMAKHISDDRKLLIAGSQSEATSGSERVFRYFMRGGEGNSYGPAIDLGLPLGEATKHTRNGGFRLSPDGRAVYFHSDKLPGGQGGHDIWVCRRVLKEVPSSGLDLLTLVDLKRDSGVGNWRQVADGIACDNPAGASVLQLPYELPDEYDVEIEFTPTAPGMNVNHYLAAQGATFAWKLNAHGRTPPLYGLELLDGKFMTQRSEGITPFDVALQVGQRYRSTVEMRKGAIRGLLDGREIMQWTGDFKRLSMETVTPMPFPGRLGIGSWRRAVTFHKVTVREVSSPGKLHAVLTGSASPSGAGRQPTAVAPAK